MLFVLRVILLCLTAILMSSSTSTSLSDQASEQDYLGWTGEFLVELTVALAISELFIGYTKPSNIRVGLGLLASIPVASMLKQFINDEIDIIDQELFLKGL